MFIALLVPTAGGTSESLVTGTTALPPGDCTGDGQVTLDDFTEFIGCHGGPTAGLPTPSCACADLDGDGDVDLQDFRAWKMSP
jgi:hypothetical protein